MKRTISVQMDAELFERVRQKAKAERRSMAGQIVYFAERGLSDNGLDRGAGQARELVDEIEALR